MAVAVIGGGFWGSAVSRMLVEAQVEHVVVDDGNISGASRNAAGICKLSWYRQETVRRMIDGVFSYADFMDGWSWLQTQVEVDWVPELFVNAPRGTSKEHTDNYLADPLALLVPAVGGRVERLQLNSLNVELVGTDIYAEHVIVCAGAFTDALLMASELGRPTGVQPLWGRAIRFDCDDFADTPRCQTVMTRPYVHYTYRQMDGHIRGGDTVERGQRNDRHIDNLIATAAPRFRGMRNMEVFGGIRPVCKRMFVDKVHPRVIAATGGHRVGFGLAGAVANRVMDLL